MRARLVGAGVALTMLFGAHQATAATYTVDINYNLLTGTISPPSIGSGFTEFQSANIAVNLPTLYAGDVIDTTINFTQGLALSLNSPGSQLFSVSFFPNNGANNEIVSAMTQLSLLKTAGDLLISGVVSGSSSCNTCVAASVSGNFTDTSFSFRGLSAVTTITNIPQSFGSDQMQFQAWALPGSIDITHGASGVSATPLPAALPLYATGLGALALLRWRRKRKSSGAAA